MEQQLENQQIGVEEPIGQDERQGQDQEGLNESHQHNLGDEENPSDIAATDKENEAVQPKCKRKRGPTKMKDIAKDPNT